MFSYNPLGSLRGPGLLGGFQQQPQYLGLLGPQQMGSQTQNLMQQYLQSLFMRRYQPPALTGAQNTVRSQLGPGGLTYQAPVPTPVTATQPQAPAVQSPVAAADNMRTPLSASYAPWAAAFRGGQ